MNNPRMHWWHLYDPLGFETDHVCWGLAGIYSLCVPLCLVTSGISETNKWAFREDLAECTVTFSNAPVPVKSLFDVLGLCTVCCYIICSIFCFFRRILLHWCLSVQVFCSGLFLGHCVILPLLTACHHVFRSDLKICFFCWLPNNCPFLPTCLFYVLLSCL